ncbi:chromosomal replication initiator protein DnaA [Rhizomicrobium electricum]|jgi:chromosomal replication initiator protein|uniref:Chromosomal replication initiator protein DnaA n=1 Tax=Rhizomicrobium electricum TaxID=480070 RepID=A0ABP3P1V1_9PROT|nr:chromosomal replication initiator protein DnaA [Rhizomicrobium electricum]NIJ47577.1 chromosomal replication initiator protein [Rhizomicrobium electricum]
MGQSTNKPATKDWQTLWVRVRERLRKELGDPIFDAWIAPLTLENWDKDDLKIGAAKPFVRNWVANHYIARIERAFRAENAEPASIAIVVASAPSQIAPLVSKEPVHITPQPVIPPSNVSYMPHVGPEGANSQGQGLWSRMLHPQQTFDSFIPGQDNEFGHSAARAFAEGRSGDLTILYIHGGFGYGKTHLLNAAALEFRKRAKKVLFLRAEDFMRHFLGALYRKDTLNFKEELRSADVLIIDDLQHICRSAATASEFLYTVNALADLRRKVVIAADRAPAALEGLGADIKSRISGGLVLQLAKPDRDTRLDILKHRAAEFGRLRPGVAIPEDVLERIADIEDASPRELIAIFTKLATYADLTKKPVTAEMAEEAVGLRSTGTKKTSIEDIQRKTAEYYKLDVRDFHSPQRARRVARPRQVAMYLARILTTRSLPEIGRRFGGRDHTTVLHACRRVEALCQEDKEFKTEVEFLRSVLTRPV